MQIPFIHVGCGNFSLQRLKVLIEGNQFTPVACVDIDLDRARSQLSSIKNKGIEDLSNRVYTTISEAKKKHDAKVCFIFVSSKEHANLIIESLNLGMHTFCVKSIACNQDEFKKMNLSALLTPGRNNGVHSMLKKIKFYASPILP